MSIVYSKKRKRIQPINDLWEEPLQIKIWPITLTFSHSSSHSGTKKDSQRVTFVLSKMILLILSFLAVNLLSCFHEEFFKVMSKYCEYYPHIVCVRMYVRNWYLLSKNWFAFFVPIFVSIFILQKMFTIFWIFQSSWLCHNGATANTNGWWMPLKNISRATK